MSREEKKIWLSQYLALLVAIRQRHEELKQMEGLTAERIPPNTTLSQIEGKICDDIDNYTEKYLEIEMAVSGIEDVFLQSVLRYHYINGYTWDEVAEELGYDVRHIKRLHNEALDVLQSPCP